MKALLLTLLTFSIVSAQTQTIRINEVVSSNSDYFDSDGDTPDWIELFNSGSEDINLKNWSLSDNINNLKKWTFPEIIIPSNNYLLLWASGKNKEISYPRTLINRGDTFKYILPDEEPDINWNKLNYNDSNWEEGVSGFGYSDGDDATIIPNGTLSIYLRKEFIIDDINNIISLLLDIDFDDAFVAYLNGIEIARENIYGNPPSFDSDEIPTDHEAKIYTGGSPDRFVVSDFSSIINEGKNLLAIQGHNVNPSSSDFTLIPFLSAIYDEPSNNGVSPPEVLALNDDNPLHTNFKISSDYESLFLSSNDGILIDEIELIDLPPNSSIGYSNFSGEIVSFLETTPGYRNSDEEFIASIQNEVFFSETGGLKSEIVNLELSGNDSSQEIRYTLDGSEPNMQSSLYQNQITVSENKSVRARIFQKNYIPSKVSTESYVFGPQHDIDVLFLTLDPEDFFDEDSGIYVFGPDGTYNEWEPYFGANFWEDWERPIHFSYYDSELGESFNYGAGVKIFGGWSRGQNGQRSLSLFARGKYGSSVFDHSLFDELPYDEFQAIVLRSSGQDWMRSNIKDITLTSLMRGSEIDFQEHNPVATYINGEYWGMYNMREKVNEHMLASKHNIDSDKITLLSNNAEEIKGSNSEYVQLIEYVENTDLSVDKNFEFVQEQIDIKQYIIYKLSNIYFNNTDWPGNNIKFWKHPDTKWRWIMFDTDFGFGPFWNVDNYWENTLYFALNGNGDGWPNPEWSTLLFERLITNINFRNDFINRYADELNTRFLPKNVVQHIDNIYLKVQPEINRHFDRWKNDPSVWFEINNVNTHINYYINNMKIFARNRHSIAKNHIKEVFNLPNLHPITIINPALAKGTVQINNNLNINVNSWTGDYFETIPVKLTAIPNLGFEFSHWSGDITSTDQTIDFNPNEPIEIIANFSYNGPVIVYPNPVSKSITIAPTSEKFDVKLYSSLGKLLHIYKQTNQIDFSSYKRGVYFLELNTANNSVVKKIIKN